jgi:hypothetical protein
MGKGKENVGGGGIREKKKENVGGATASFFRGAPPEAFEQLCEWCGLSTWSLAWTSSDRSWS